MRHYYSRDRLVITGLRIFTYLHTVQNQLNTFPRHIKRKDVYRCFALFKLATFVYCVFDAYFICTVSVLLVPVNDNALSFTSLQKCNDHDTIVKAI